MGTTVLNSVIARENSFAGINRHRTKVSMKKTDATTPTEATDDSTPAPAEPKSATITLRAADGSSMQIVAERRADGARTYVITTDPEKKTSRGMTAVHSSWDKAVASTAATAKAAEKLGWVRRVAGRKFAPKPDAFSTLPAASAAPKGKK